MKKEVNLNKLSKQQLIEFYIKKCEELDRVQAKFRELQEEHNETLKENERLKEKIALSLQRMFGKKTESNKKIKEEPLNEAEKIAKKSKGGRTKDSRNFDVEFLEKNVTETTVLEPEEYNEIKNNSNIIHIGDDVSYKVKYKPASIEVHKYITKKYFDKENKRFYQAVKNDPFPHSICSASLAANVIANKFLYGLPYYRQSEVMMNDGLHLSRQDLCNFQLRTTEILKPFYVYLKKQLLNNSAHVINADETTLRVIETDKSKCYVWVYCTSFYNNPIYIYEYCKTRSRDNVTNFLNGYEGYLLTDGYNGYKNIAGITNAYCRAHARRKFVEILKTLTAEQQKESVSLKIVKLIDKLFVKEAQFKKNLYGPQKILEMRNEPEYIEIIDSIFKILKDTDPSKGSALENAFKYILDREGGFRSFLSDGHVELSNNISERAIKPFVIARKNFLFSNTENGAESSLIYFSIQQTARANNLDPIKYIEKLINILGTKNTITDELLESLLPRNIKIE